ncbi:MAG: PAS domain S-box protein [Deltaproteobacteria bacterium]|nr:MAG: PAS domain S-box protein [Deltaproteobacteria bacterium]
MTIEPPRGKVLVVGLAAAQRHALERALAAGHGAVILQAHTTDEALAGLEIGGVEVVVAATTAEVDGDLALRESARRRPLARRIRVTTGAPPALDGVVDVPAEAALETLPALVRELLEAEVVQVEGQDDVLGLVLDVSLVPMLTCDAAGTIIATNPRLDDLFGYAAGELIGIHVDALLPIPARTGHADRMRRFFADPRPRRMAGRRVRGLSRQGEELPLEVSLLPVRVRAGARVLVSALDLRRRLEVDDRMLRAQRLESVGLMIGGCVHDLRNLLLTLRLGVETLQADRGAGSTEMLVTAVGAIEALSGDMMRLLDGREATPVPVDLNAVVERLEPMLERLVGRRIGLMCVLSAVPCTVLAVPVQIEQILVNLVANARDAIGTGEGQITVSTWASLVPGHVVLRVEDDGPGMAPEVASKAFDAFFTTKRAGQGTGLGLAVCRTVAERLGGTLALETAPGEGCCFDLTLPARPAEVVVARGDAQG